MIPPRMNPSLTHRLLRLNEYSRVYLLYWSKLCRGFNYTSVYRRRTLLCSVVYTHTKQVPLKEQLVNVRVDDAVAYKSI